MSENETPDSGMGSLATKLLQDPDTQKALLDITQPILQVQEAIFQQIIDQQNKILVALQAIVDSQVETKAQIADILAEVKK